MTSFSSLIRVNALPEKGGVITHEHLVVCTLQTRAILFIYVGFPGHVTKMAAMPIYHGQNPYHFVLVDSQVSDNCPWANCYSTYCKIHNYDTPVYGVEPRQRQFFDMYFFVYGVNPIQKTLSYNIMSCVSKFMFVLNRESFSYL